MVGRGVSSSYLRVKFNSLMPRNPFKYPNFNDLPSLDSEKFRIFRSGPADQQQAFGETQRSHPQKPGNFVGSDGKWAIYWAHQRLGRLEHRHFRMNPDEFTGVDFLELDRPIAIGVIETEGKTLYQLQAELLANYHGYRLIWIQEEDAKKSPISFLQDALNGIDRSGQSEL